VRGSDVQGRFSIPYETSSIWEGIRDELASPVGVAVDWYRWEASLMEGYSELVVDDIYDVSSSVADLGRMWEAAVQVPVVTAQIYQGRIQQNDRGFYNTDTLRLVVDVEDALRAFPDICSSPDSHIKDRVVFRGEVFTPVRVYPRGHIGYNFAVITIDCVQVNPEELVNDPQFYDFAQGSDPQAVLTVPDAPTGLVAVAEVTAVVLDWEPPANDGGAPITAYMVASDDGLIYQTVDMTLAGATSTAAFTGLSASESYQFVVAAVNRLGTGEPSEACTAVVPLPEIQ
jgi:hypothetical protein